MSTPLLLDNVYDVNQLKQFASQIEHISHGDVAILRDKLRGEQSADFYYGVISALAFVWQTKFLSGPDHMKMVGQAVAVVADHIIRGKT